VSSTLRRIVLNELHALILSKRGDLLSLALARLRRLSPDASLSGAALRETAGDAGFRYLCGGLDIRHAGFLKVFGALGFTAHLLGERRLYSFAAARCLAD